MPHVVSTLSKDRGKAAGLGTKTNPAKHLNQDFEALRRKCLGSGQPFLDPTFPASSVSLGPNLFQGHQVMWKRPKELHPEPKFIISGATRTDICQGQLGDCWLMAAIASLTLDQKKLACVIYPEQSFTKDHAGIFHFKLWQYGQWVDVVIDDLLPTENGKLLFVHSSDRNEFWSALLEKAYAKVNGSYEALHGGTASEAFEDFTGGITENYAKLSEAPTNLFKIMKQALSRGSLLCTSICDSSRNEDKTVENLVKQHAYSITGAEEVHVRGTAVQLVRLRNPWGKTEWNGPWSDTSKEWDSVHPEEKARLNFSVEDGEFWMEYSDYKKRYSQVEICNLTPDTSSSGHVGNWALQQFEGSWRVNLNAGGCGNNRDTFWRNPQYRISLLEEDDDPLDKENACSLLVSLMQKDRRRLCKQGQGNYLIGFQIYKIPKELGSSQSQHLGKDFFLTRNPCFINTFCNSREVSARIRLPPGDYVIMPSTFNPGEEADFILRVFTEKHSKMGEVDNDVSFTFDNQREITEQDMQSSIRDIFAQLAGQDKEISAEELRTFLNTLALSELTDLKTDSFSLELCRNIVDLLDEDVSGRLSLVEFQILWKKIVKWLDIFSKFDLDKSGTINSYEIQPALEMAGFKLNNKLIQALVTRYAVRGEIDFDNFVCCLVKLEGMLSAYKLLDTGGTGVTTLNVSEWLFLTVCI